MDFTGQTVVVTGGSRGIGKEIARMFAQGGAQVVVVYRVNREAAEVVLDELPGVGHSAFPCHIGNPENVEKLFEQILDHYDRIDIVVNNAGIGFHHPIDTCSLQEWYAGWDSILDTNLKGPAYVCFHAARHMIGKGGGKIINVSSRGAFRGEPDQPAYGASKAGLNSMTQSLAQKLAPHNIFVGAVAPGFVETDMAYDRLQGESGKQIKAQSPMNRVAKPEEVAQAVGLMASANQWMTGGIFDVNGASYLRS